MGRRRSLSEMMDACITDPSNEGVRRRILNYLEMGRFSESLDKAREEPENLLENIGPAPAKSEKGSKLSSEDKDFYNFDKILDKYLR